MAHSLRSSLRYFWLFSPSSSSSFSGGPEDDASEWVKVDLPASGRRTHDEKPFSCEGRGGDVVYIHLVLFLFSPSTLSPPGVLLSVKASSSSSSFPPEGVLLFVEESRLVFWRATDALNLPVFRGVSPLSSALSTKPPCADGAVIGKEEKGGRGGEEG